VYGASPSACAFHPRSTMSLSVYLYMGIHMHVRMHISRLGTYRVWRLAQHVRLPSALDHVPLRLVAVHRHLKKIMKDSKKMKLRPCAQLWGCGLYVMKDLKKKKKGYRRCLNRRRAFWTTDRGYFFLIDHVPVGLVAVHRRLKQNIKKETSG